MHQTLIIKASRLSDDALLSRCEQLAARARETTVELIAHLAEVERRRLYRGEGTGSLYGYCRQVLLMSEHAAYHRMRVARAVLEFPAILDLLAEGSVNLTTIRLLAPHLTAESHRALLTEAIGKSRRDVQKIVARLAPQPDVKSSVRRLPAPQQSPASPPAVSASTAAGSTAVVGTAPASFLAAAVAGPSGPLPPVPRGNRPVVEPLAPERYRVQFTIGEETEAKLRRLQDLLRREIPDGDPAAIFDRALTLLLADVEKKKLAASPKPKTPPAAVTTPPAAAGSRMIPAHVRRAVARRDGGRCAFVAPKGRRCSEQSFLEFHHVRPYAYGGEATIENISLRCRTHNVYESEIVFGARVPPPSNLVRTEFTGGIPDFARTPLA